MRCVHESKVHSKNSFLTLTYDSEHVPKDMGLHVGDWQRFAKRVRKSVGKFRFLMCGEYGDKNLRPHFHVCCFGQDFSEDRSVWQTKPDGSALFVSPKLGELWGNGFATIGAVSFQSAAYVARYTMKKVNGELAAERYLRSDGERTWRVRPEFATMSRRPGLGSEWLERFWTDVYPDDFVVIEGRKVRPPAFYDNWLDAKDPEMLDLCKKKRIVEALKQSEHQTEDRLRVREKVVDAKLALHSRPLDF